MGLRETEESTENVLARMENSLNSLEQMSLDSINITDKLVNGIDELGSCIDELQQSSEQDRAVIHDMIGKLLRELLETAFTVNNVSHELEKETAYQRDTVDSIRQIVDYLYGMTDNLE